MPRYKANKKRTRVVRTDQEGSIEFRSFGFRRKRKGKKR